MLVWGLGITGTVLMYTQTKKVNEDPSISESEATDIGKWTFLALMVLIVASSIIPRLFTSMIPLTISFENRLLFAWFYAINEETFFRGGLLLSLASKIPNAALVSFLSGFVFNIFHFSVYGTQPENLGFVLVAGFTLGYVVLKGKRLTPAYLAHIFNNTYAVIS